MVTDASEKKTPCVCFGDVKKKEKKQQKRIFFILFAWGSLQYLKNYFTPKFLLTYHTSSSQLFTPASAVIEL